MAFDKSFYNELLHTATDAYLYREERLGFTNVADITAMAETLAKHNHDNGLNKERAIELMQGFCKSLKKNTRQEFIDNLPVEMRRDFVPELMILQEMPDAVNHTRKTIENYLETAQAFAQSYDDTRLAVEKEDEQEIRECLVDNAQANTALVDAGQKVAMGIDKDVTVFKTNIQEKADSTNSFDETKEKMLSLSRSQKKDFEVLSRIPAFVEMDLNKQLDFVIEYNKGRHPIPNAVEKMVQTGKNVVAKITEAINKAFGNAIDFCKTVEEGAKDLAVETKNEIIDKINEDKTAINNFKAKITDSFKNFKDSVRKGINGSLANLFNKMAKEEQKFVDKYNELSENFGMKAM